MARPTKWRRIEHIPTTSYFIPSSNSAEIIPENILKLEELEAIRLKDLEGFEQEECAKRMEVSRATFQRILLAAREKVADCLVNGKALHIEGGNFTRKVCPVHCVQCGKEWSDSFENLEAIKENYTCPKCGSFKVCCKKNCNEKLCSKRMCHKQ
ncbi:DUF134 domain-containing protein [Candidatus Galacturonibacter soehngenii]|uniref:UPF0251 protein F7O84_09495 n=1 Tax=Candidatus Galacturonatibacter soehngenii TaxID=2307010 RepID=A0A7V7UFT6_9FIRM|nr:DUF134 domain-containing protein [Candidatus Galacturonibacter soehngenii]KAB1437816.1 DUF134 domain-containing protein [Candidatus Galacturonibacter soehngenii]MBA4687415.1 DUF134 domain-containing protein [Candidatus Galacturonibacter soehngenii]